MVSAFRMFFMIFWTFSLMILAPLFIPLTLNRQFPLLVARTFFAPVLMRIVGIKLTTIGKENVPQGEPVIFVANHCSHLDIACLCNALPVNLHFIGKKELMWTPVVGWYMLVAGHIFIDRKSRVKAAASLKKAAEKIKQGKSVVMYPEGTRSNDGNVGPFKKGAFHLAVQAGVKIIPVSIKGTYQVWSKNASTITPSDVVVKIGQPIDTTAYGNDNLKGLMELTRNAIINMQQTS
ncbi:MAG: 1-acyl-sn-glycerol-3-phosphate acyltransferase [Vicingus serpentipes]|nr:1-acyl-sn-glycerol-3-phosphate acyltransferase [Vicingus serpentipes]